MTFKTAREMIEDTGMVFNIGQLDADCIRQLNRSVKRGEIAKIRTMWPWREWGLVEKTAYCMPYCAEHYSVKKRLAT